MCKFNFRDDTYASFGELRDRMQAIKDENKTDPVLLSSVSKVMREVVSASGILHAADQAADNKAFWEPEIPIDTYERALAQVQYHTTVALRSRPPGAMSLTSINVCVNDTVDSLRLRRTLCNMLGQENISGTMLRKYGISGDSTPDQWKTSDGRYLEELGFITINPRSHGFSVNKKPIPDKETDPEGYEHFANLLSEKLRLDVADYAQS